MAKIILCPNCKSEFDVTKEIDKWKEEVLTTLEFFEKLKKIKN